MNDKFSVRTLWQAWRGWFAVGIGVKRWLIVLAVGAVIAAGIIPAGLEMMDRLAIRAAEDFAAAAH